MMKEALMVGGAAAVGGFVVSQWGGPIENMAVKAHIPPLLAHGAVVALTTTLVFIGLRAVL